MDYKNLLYRSIFASALLAIYLISLSNSNLLFIFAIIIYLIIIYECFIYFKNYFYLTFCYIILSLICFCLYFFNLFNFYFFNILLFVIIIFDSFSYFSGLLFGKIYIFKKISPKKTFEGYLGGIFFTNLIILFYLIFITGLSEIIPMLIFINVLIIFAIMGDLIESFFKRKNNIKHSSNLLPGHGGFFDRFDSFLPSVIFLLLYSL